MSCTCGHPTYKPTYNYREPASTAPDSSNELLQSLNRSPDAQNIVLAIMETMVILVIMQ